MQLKDKKIKILQEQVEDTDNQGFCVSSGWTPIHNGELWAYYRQLSGKEINAAGMTELQAEDALFVVNWRADLTTDMIIQYRGKHYDIKRIDDFQGYKTDLSVYCAYNAARREELDSAAGK